MFCLWVNIKKKQETAVSRKDELRKMGEAHMEEKLAEKLLSSNIPLEFLRFSKFTPPASSAQTGRTSRVKVGSPRSPSKAKSPKSARASPRSTVKESSSMSPHGNKRTRATYWPDTVNYFLQKVGDAREVK